MLDAALVRTYIYPYKPIQTCASIMILIPYIYMYQTICKCQAYEMFDSNTASWVALVAQLVENLSGVKSVVGSNPT